MASRRLLDTISEVDDSVLAMARSEVNSIQKDLQQKAAEFDSLLQNEVYLVASIVGRILASRRLEGKDSVVVPTSATVIDKVRAA